MGQEQPGRRPGDARPQGDPTTVVARRAGPPTESDPHKSVTAAGEIRSISRRIGFVGLTTELVRRRHGRCGPMPTPWLAAMRIHAGAGAGSESFDRSSPFTEMSQAAAAAQDAGRYHTTPRCGRVTSDVIRRPLHGHTATLT